MYIYTYKYMYLYIYICRHIYIYHWVGAERIAHNHVYTYVKTLPVGSQAHICICLDQGFHHLCGAPAMDEGRMQTQGHRVLGDVGQPAFRSWGRAVCCSLAEGHTDDLGCSFTAPDVERLPDASAVESAQSKKGPHTNLANLRKHSCCQPWASGFRTPKSPSGPATAPACTRWSLTCTTARKPNVRANWADARCSRRPSVPTGLGTPDSELTT